MPIIYILIGAFLFSACEYDPHAGTEIMCVEAGPPEKVREFYLKCVGHAPDDEYDKRPSKCMEATYTLHCTRKARVRYPTYFTAGGPQHHGIVKEEGTD